MTRTLAAAVCLGLVAWAGTARADTIYLKNSKKTLTGTIGAETAKGITFKGLKEVVPAEDVRDIDYDVKPADVRLKAYLPATLAEAKVRSATTDKERLKELDVAIAKYQAGLPKIDPAQKFARRQMAFKVAFLTAEKAELTGGAGAKVVAIGKLKDFWKKNPDCWQIARVLKKLTQMQVEQKAFDDAAETLKALAEAPVSEAVRQEAELAGAQLSMKAGKYDDARQKLEAIAGKLPKDSPAGQKARVAQAECLAAVKNLPAARDVVQKVLAEAKGPDVKAAAYNILGYCDLQADNLKEARWAFLWVDLVYNQSPAEHARALYYLNQVFSRMNEPDRAHECLEALLNDRQFAGLDYQRKAQEERKQQGQ
jgi:hypothetical protein